MITTLKNIFKNVKLSSLIVIIILLLFNSYAWFIYSTKVSGGLTAHITSWNVLFKAGTEDTTTNIDVNVDNIYPGMEKFEQKVTAYNSGEMQAKLTYEIKLVRILDQTYIINDTTTSGDLANRIKNDYPFIINIEIDNENIVAQNGQATLTISLTWQFESENDDEDTRWGELAYEYFKENPTKSSINMNIEIKATQE